MAQRITSTLTDDIDGSEHGVKGVTVTTHRFSLDGSDYEIDLKDANGELLAASLAPFIACARPSRRPLVLRQKTRTTADRERSASIRSWAQAEGLDVADAGRIGRTVRERYNAVHGTNW